MNTLKLQQQHHQTNTANCERLMSRLYVIFLHTCYTDTHATD